MAEAKDKSHVAAIGLNFSDGEGLPEKRFDVGDAIPSTLVEPWMLDDGLVTVAAPKKPAHHKPSTSTGASS